jgi:PPP family 3-phenylpropionic acid transporter
MTSSEQTSPSLSILLAFGVFYFFYFILIGVYIIYLPQMLKSYGYSPTEVGVIYAAAPMMRFLLPFVFRHYISLDERVYKVALGAMVLSTLLTAFSVDSFGLYLMASILLGGAMGAVLPYVDTVSLQVVSKEHYGKVRLWGSVGFITIALWMGQALSTLNQVFVYLNVAALFTMIAGMYLVHFDPHRKQTIDRDEERAFSLTKYWAFWISVFLLQVSFGGFYNFFTIYETAHGFSQTTISYLWSFGVIFEVAMLYFQGPLLRNNLLSVIKLTTFSAVLRWGLLWLWPDSLMSSYASQMLHAVSFALYYTATISYVFQLYTQKKLAQQFYLGITFGLGGSLGALLAGWIYEEYSSQLFAIEAFFALGALVMMFVHEYRRRRGHELG